MSTVPVVTKDVPFVPAWPNIRLYLGSNSLSVLPRNLFYIQNLTSLSLRNNNLTELPHAIGQLRNLNDLNIANNELRYLPIELLELLASPSDSSRLDKVQLHPNPYLQPLIDNMEDHIRPDRANAALYWGRSEIQFSDYSGRIYSDIDLDKLPGSSVVATSTSVSWPSKSRRPGQTDYPNISHVPSLVDIALRVCYDNPALPHLADMIQGHDRLKTLLAELAMSRELGPAQCDVCTRTLLKPRTKWLEWWIMSHGLVSNYRGDDPVWRDVAMNDGIRNELFVPFINRGCSWQCVPVDHTGDIWIGLKPLPNNSYVGGSMMRRGPHRASNEGDA